MREPLWSIGCDAQRLTSVAADDKLRIIQPCATLPTLRASQVENRKAAATSSPNVEATGFSLVGLMIAETP
jgi:hypothetical protein